MLAGVFLIVILAMAVSTRQYAAAWQSEPALWARAIRLAPEKPRTINNYGVSLVILGRFADARTAFERAHTAGHSPRLPAWDRVEGETTSRTNLKALDALMGEQP